MIGQPRIRLEKCTHLDEGPEARGEDKTVRRAFIGKLATRLPKRIVERKIISRRVNGVETTGSKDMAT